MLLPKLASLVFLDNDFDELLLLLFIDKPDRPVFNVPVSLVIGVDPPPDDEGGRGGSGDEAAASKGELLEVTGFNEKISESSFLLFVLFDVVAAALDALLVALLSFAVSVSSKEKSSKSSQAL